MTKYDRFEFRGGDDPEIWLWCLHCERCYQLKDMREVKHPFLKGETLQLCHYEDCDGDTVLDGWDWEEVREDTDWPEIPVIGVTYSQ